MRCNGRFTYAEFLPQDARFPIILPRKNCVTRLWIMVGHSSFAGEEDTPIKTLLVCVCVCFFFFSFP